MLPPAYLLISLVLMGALWFVLPGPRIVPEPWNLGGLALIGAGIALNAIGDAQFKRAMTVMHPFGRPSTLVTTGVFAFSRNPMYLGLILLLCGAAVLVGRATPFVAPVLLFAVLNFGFVPREEHTMAACFGEDYLTYRSRVRRWL